MYSLHINRIKIGALFAINLDAHKVAVQNFGGGRVLKALVLHHMTPVAGRIADAQKNRLVLRLRARQRFRAPRKPIHWIAAVLLQIGTGLLCETVGHALSLTPVRQVGQRPGNASRCVRAG